MTHPFKELLQLLQADCALRCLCLPRHREIFALEVPLPPVTCKREKKMIERLVLRNITEREAVSNGFFLPTRPL